MTRAYTTDALIGSVQRRASIPLNQSTFTRAQVLLFGDDEILNTIIPMVRESRQQHFVTYADQTTTTATTYDIPTEAMNRALYNVVLVDSSGREAALVMMDLDREIDGIPPGLQPLSGSPPLYYVRGDKVKLYPNVVAGQTLRLYYERLPNRLCLSSAYTNPTESAEAGLITGISAGTITCSGGVPSTISTSTPICAVQSTPGFGLRFSNVTPSGKTGTTVVTTSANAALCSVGDWIALDGDSPIVQLPVETHSILAEAIAAKCLEALGDENMPMAQQKLDRAVALYKKSFPNRVEQSPAKLGSRNTLLDWVIQ